MENENNIQSVGATYYTNDIYYEFRFDQDGSVSAYYIGLWVKDEKLMNLSDFKCSIDELRIEEIGKITVTKDSKGIYIRTPKIKITLVSDKFNLFYKATLDLIKKNIWVVIVWKITFKTKWLIERNEVIMLVERNKGNESAIQYK